MQQLCNGGIERRVAHGEIDVVNFLKDNLGN